jgi:hypothetical protein
MLSGRTVGVLALALALALALVMIVGMAQMIVPETKTPSEAPAAAVTPASTTTPAPAPTSSSAPASPEVSETPTLESQGECHFKEPWAGDLFAVYITPGLETTAQAFGGSWVWDASAEECVTSQEMVLRGTPPGSCTEVGLASKNPDFDPDLPGAHLDVVDEARGDC